MSSAPREVVLSRLFKWDHVVELSDTGTEGHAIDKLKDINANELNSDIGLNADLVFDLILERMIECYAMYVYCPVNKDYNKSEIPDPRNPINNDGIEPVIKFLKSKANANAIKSAIIKGIGTDSTPKEVHQAVQIFVTRATQLVTMEFVDKQGRITAKENDKNSDKIGLFVNHLKEDDQETYKMIENISRSESLKFSREDGGKNGIQKNHREDHENADLQNIDDILKHHAEMRASFYQTYQACNKNLHRDDYSIACSIQSRTKYETSNAVTQNLEMEVPGLLSRVTETEQNNGSAQTAQSKNAEVLYQAYAVLLDQARLRLTHGSELYSKENKLALNADKTMSEAYVRFYDRHLTDFVRSMHPESGVHVYYLGAAVSQVHFKLMREKCDAAVREICREEKDRACSPNVSVEFNTEADYSRFYSHEMKMFHLTCRPFVDQYISVYGRLDRETILVMNEFDYKPKELTIRELKNMAGDQYSKYYIIEHRDFLPRITRQKFPDKFNTFYEGMNLDFLTGRSVNNTTDNLEPEEKKRIEEYLDDTVDLVSLSLIPTSNLKESQAKPFTVTSSDNAQCPYVLNYTPCTGDGDGDRDCYGEVNPTKQLKSLKAFDMSAREEAMRNVANSAMMGYSAVMQRGTVLMGFGGSGVGKTSLFFGRDDGNRYIKGLLSYLFDSLPEKFPFHGSTNNTEVKLTVIELYAENNTFYYDEEGRRGTQKTVIENLYENQDNVKLAKDLSDITDKVDKTRKTSKIKTIKATDNNKNSSRSVMIYHIEYIYRGQSKELDIPVEDKNKTCTIDCSGLNDVNIPITLIDLPGYELPSMVGESYKKDETRFINETVESCVDWSYKGQYPETFRTRLEGMDLGLETSRLISFVVFNNLSGNEKKQKLESVYNNGKFVALIGNWSNDPVPKQEPKPDKKKGRKAEPEPKKPEVQNKKKDTKIPDEFIAKLGFKQRSVELLAALNYASEYVNANVKIARRLFHKMHEDQRIMFDLLYAKQDEHNVC